MVVSVILERNPELEFQDKVDLDKLVKEAFHDFQKDQNRLKGTEKQVSKICIPGLQFFLTEVIHILNNGTLTSNPTIIT